MEVDPTTGVAGSIRFKTPRAVNRSRKTKATVSNSRDREKRVDTVPSSVAEKENKFTFKFGANVYTSKRSASEAIRTVLTQAKKIISEVALSNGVKKVLKGKITLNELVTSIQASEVFVYCAFCNTVCFAI